VPDAFSIFSRAHCTVTAPLESEKIVAFSALLDQNVSSDTICTLKRNTVVVVALVVQQSGAGEIKAIPPVWLSLCVSAWKKDRYFLRNEIKKGADAWRQMLTVRTNSEDVDLVAPELAQALDNRTGSEFGLQIPSRFQGNTLTRAHPVMHHFSSCRAQGSVTITSKRFPWS
jgi:hypothetical protein